MNENNAKEEKNMLESTNIYLADYFPHIITNRKFTYFRYIYLYVCMNVLIQKEN